MLGLRKIEDTFGGVPALRSIKFGSILGSPHFGKLPCRSAAYIQISKRSTCKYCGNQICIMQLDGPLGFLLCEGPSTKASIV